MLWKFLLPSLSRTAVSCLEHPKSHQHSKAMPKFALQTPSPLLMDYFHCLKRLFLLLWYFSSGIVAKSFSFYLSIQSSAIFFSVRLTKFLTDNAFKLPGCLKCFCRFSNVFWKHLYFVCIFFLSIFFLLKLSLHIIECLICGLVVQYSKHYIWKKTFSL